MKLKSSCNESGVDDIKWLTNLCNQPDVDNAKMSPTSKGAYWPKLKMTIKLSEMLLLVFHPLCKLLSNTFLTLWICVANIHLIISTGKLFQERRSDIDLSKLGKTGVQMCACLKRGDLIGWEVNLVSINSKSLLSNSWKAIFY